VTVPLARDRVGSVLRAAEIAVLLGIAVALVAFQQEYRHLEAVLASHVFGGGGVRTFTSPDLTSVVFRMGETRAFGLEISPECTSAFLIAPFALIGAAVRFGRRMKPGRVIFGVTLVSVLMVACNQLRVGMIAGLINAYGMDDGYRWGHLILGSLLSILFLALSAAVLLYVVASGRRAAGVVTA